MTEFEKARREVAQRLENYGLALRPRPVAEKSALYRAVQHWEGLFVDQELPLQELALWECFLHQSQKREPSAAKTAADLLELVKGPYHDPALDLEAPVCNQFVINEERRSVIIRGKPYRLSAENGPKLLRILRFLCKGNAENPLSSSQVAKHFPGLKGRGGEKQLRRLLDRELPQEVRAWIHSREGRGGGRWIGLPKEN